MREIKFRGHDGAAWRYGDLIHDSCNGRELIFIDDNVERTRHSVKQDTVGQFTGLKDSEGREIYEGDIIQNEDLFPHTRGVVCYDAYLTRFYIDTGDGDINDLRQDEENCVIGNVHDNPDLLEKQP